MGRVELRVPVAPKKLAEMIGVPKGNGHRIDTTPGSRDIETSGGYPFTGSGFTRSGRPEYLVRSGQLDPVEGAEAIVRDSQGNFIQRFVFEFDPNVNRLRWMPR